MCNTRRNHAGYRIRQYPLSSVRSFRQHSAEAVHDITYENCQARERTQILMDVANKEGGFVIGTGDLSELALGWCTYNGDHMSMYAVNTSIKIPFALRKGFVCQTIMANLCHIKITDQYTIFKRLDLA